MQPSVCLPRAGSVFGAAFLLLIISPVLAQVEPAPQIPAYGKSIDSFVPKGSIQIPKRVSDYLAKNYPHWIIEKNEDGKLEFISGDFDGNGKEDYAFMIRIPNAQWSPENPTCKHLVLLNRGAKFEEHHLRRDGFPFCVPGMALRRKGSEVPKYVDGFPSDAPDFYPNDAITIQGEKAGDDCYYSKGKFVCFLSSD